MVRAERESNPLENAVNIAQRLVVPEAEHAIALGFEICGAGFVGTPQQRVLAAVELNDQLGFRAAEIRNEGADRMLATKLLPFQLSIAKEKPQLPLCLRF